MPNRGELRPLYLGYKIEQNGFERKVLNPIHLPSRQELRFNRGIGTCTGVRQREFTSSKGSSSHLFPFSLRAQCK